ncbi:MULTISPECIES: zinc ribbon domain-containing protein [Clostridia]|uniref:zinc ribbon domain-containing protein n=1 Tax=Clostridia TaxID=186801 RepID=UPI000E4C4F6C|nr:MULTISPECIES: zinc ribbon domain-containing protein [Clostridia]RHV71499.1 zinc ribbon domain-containing protein [Roseburia sp. OM02-15]
MFCKNCGNELENNAMFCGKCGTPVRQDTKGSPFNTEINSMTGAVKNKGKKKLWKAIIAIVVVIGVFLVGSHVYDIKFGYKKVIKQYINGTEKMDWKVLSDLWIDEYYEVLSEDISDGKTDPDEFRSSEHTNKKKVLAEFENIDDCSVDVIIDDENTGDREDINEVEDSYENYGLEINIKRMVKVDVHTDITYETVDGETHEKDYDETIYIAQIDGEWRLTMEKPKSMDKQIGVYANLFIANEEYK